MKRSRTKTRKVTQRRPWRSEKYRPEMAVMAQAIIAHYGYDAGVLAEVCGVTPECIATWAAKRSDFREAVRDGKERFEQARPDAEKNKEVEAALLKSALGHGWEEEKRVTDADGRVTVTVTRGQTAPDAAACMKWLRNRWPERWPDKQDVNVSGKVDGPPTIIIKKMYSGGKVESKQVMTADDAGSGSATE